MFGFLSQVKINPGKRAVSQSYYNALLGAGITMSASQQRAFNTFVTEGITNDWWRAVSRLYLPVWGSAGANAIDASGNGSAGSFVGTVSHANKKVQSVGANGYFNSGWINPNQAGASARQGVFVYSVDHPNNGGVFAGAGDAGGFLQLDGYFLRGYYRSGIGPSAVGPTGTFGAGGFLGFSDGASVTMLHRTSAGVLTNVGSATASGNAPSVSLFFGAQNASGTPGFYSTSSFACFIVLNDSLTLLQAQLMMESVQNLINVLRA